MLIGEAGSRVPDAELVDARKTLRILALIDGILGFTHPERAARETERRAVLVALLRDVVAVRACRIAGEYRGKQREIVRGGEFEARARRGERIGRSTARHVGGKDGGPAEGAVDQTACRGADDEFVVAGKLAETQRHVMGETLLEPGGEQACRRDGVDIARIEKAADVIGGIPAAVVDLKDGDMRRRALPSDQ